MQTDGIFGVLRFPQLLVCMSKGLKTGMQSGGNHRTPKNFERIRVHWRSFAVQKNTAHYPFKSIRAFWCALVILAFIGSPFHLHAAAPSETQTIMLDAGWNMISVQVGDSGGFTVGDIEAALDTPGIVKAMWGYDAASKSWQSYQPLKAGFPNDLTHVYPGRGYWVEVANQTVLELTAMPWDGDIVLVQGWNLVGFPGLNTDMLESLELRSVFGVQFDRIAEVWGFDPAAGFSGHDVTSIPQVRDLTHVETGRAYWLNVIEAFALNPIPEIALIGDADASPLQDATNLVIGVMLKVAGAEDMEFDLNSNGYIDTAFTQDTLRFDDGIPRRKIFISNGGTGLLNWSVENGVPWMSVDVIHGTVSTERDYITLEVERDGLIPGVYTSTNLVVHAGNLSKVISVIMEVSAPGGDYKGVATTVTVNGKPINIGAVNMELSVIMDSENRTEKNFRAVVDADRSLLFPRDVYMNGIFYQNNKLSLTTSYFMGPGDLNVPPFETFEHDPNETNTDPFTGDQRFTDKDYNDDGLVDNANPFPFPIFREVTLLGERITLNRWVGTYTESIDNLLPEGEDIIIEGTFYLDRIATKPSKKTAFSEPDRPSGQVDSIGGSGQPHSYTNTLTFTDPVEIDGAQITLNLDFPAIDKLQFQLTGPGGGDADKSDHEPHWCV